MNSPYVLYYIILQAQQPGRLRHGHYEMMRLTIGRKMDPNRMFAIWRIDPPWQPVTKKVDNYIKSWWKILNRLIV